MDSPVSAQEPEHDDIPSTPRRLSAPYQYHNAPEVAPAYGLEYDDTLYPISDKMTIIRDFPFRHHACRDSRNGYDIENQPPRIICGMKIGTFLVVASIVLLIVAGAAVGGAVGGRTLHQSYYPSATYGHASCNASTTSTPLSPSHTAPPTPTSTPYTAPIPTSTPLSSCSSPNGATTYTSPFTLTTSTHSSLGNQTFSMYCGLAPTQAATRIAGAYVYTFADCVDICAAYNFAHDGTACNLAFYEPGAPRPANCWIAQGEAIVSALEAKPGTDVGVLVPLPP